MVGSTSPGLFSIGHSNASLGTLLDLLGRHSIDVLADVRTHPRSQYVPHFDAGPLRAALLERGIRYAYLGKELGGRPRGSEFYDDEGFVLYERLADSELFRSGLERVLRGAKEYRVVLLCSEEDPSGCHRHLLIGQVLNGLGILLQHIRHDGRTQQDDEIVRATTDQSEAAQSVLFQAPKEREWKSLRSVSPERRPQSSLEP